MPRLALALVLALNGCAPGAGEQAATTTNAPAAISSTTTTAAPTAAPWAVVVIGDFGTGAQAELTIAAQVQQWVVAHPETVALITTGDNFYTSDVAAAWAVPYGWVAQSGLPVWATPGNHDVQTPQQWQASVEAFGSFPRWRAKEAGGVTFVLLDSNQADDPVQAAWLEEVGAGLHGQPWVVVFHHPAVSCGRYSEPAALRTDAWAPLLDGARLVLNGHDHNYQRFATKDGWRVITGGAGADRLYPIGPCTTEHPDLVTAVSAHHFLTIEVSEATATVTAHGIDGTVLDRFLVDLAMRP